VNAGGFAVHEALVRPAALVTSTVTVHDAGPAGTATLLTAMVLPPAVAVAAAAALLQVPPMFAVGATTSPAGKLSAKLMALAGARLAANKVKVNVVTPREAMVVGLKLLLKIGLTTANEALSPIGAEVLEQHAGVNSPIFAVVSWGSGVICVPA